MGQLSQIWKLFNKTNRKVQFETIAKPAYELKFELQA